MEIKNLITLINHVDYLYSELSQAQDAFNLNRDILTHQTQQYINEVTELVLGKHNLYSIYNGVLHVGGTHLRNDVCEPFIYLYDITQIISNRGPAQDLSRLEPDDIVQWWALTDNNTWIRREDNGHLGFVFTETNDGPFKIELIQELCDTIFKEIGVLVDVSKVDMSNLTLSNPMLGCGLIHLLDGRSLELSAEIEEE